MDTSERLKNLIARFVLRYNYWGYLFARIKRRPSTSMPSIMGVGGEPDGTLCLYYHPDLVRDTDEQTLVTLLEHEGLHILNKHIPRLLRILSNEVKEESKYHKSHIWNLAADCTVNQQAKIENKLNIAGIQCLPVTPKSLNVPPGKITEWYYLELLKRKDHQTKEKDSQGKNSTESDGTRDSKMGGFDSHDNWTKNLGSVSDLSSLSRKIDQHVQGIIAETLKTFGQDRGRMPAHIAELIQSALMPPKAPYYQIIRKLVRGTRFTKFMRSPTRINRKRTYAFVLGDNLPKISPFPGRKRDFTFDVVVMIDTSGSMSIEDIKEGLSGVRNIIENDRHCYTTVLEVDAGVEKEYEVKKIKDIQFNIKGRGGTTLYPGLERAKELNCDVCLVFTDGYCENINEIPRKLLPKKIIWIIQKNGSPKNVNRTGYIVRI